MKACLCVAGKLQESYTDNGRTLSLENYTEKPESQAENSKDFLKPGSLFYTTLQSYSPKLSLLVLLCINRKILEVLQWTLYFQIAVCFVISPGWLLWKWDYFTLDPSMFMSCPSNPLFWVFLAHDYIMKGKMSKKLRVLKTMWPRKQMEGLLLTITWHKNTLAQTFHSRTC